MHKLILIALSLMSLTANGNDMNFFGSPIDFWSKKESKQASTKKNKPTQNAKKFDWKKYKDPNTKDFFKEGDYLPPEPFVELVKNPTDENIKNWFAYIELKNKLSNRLQKRLKIYADKNAPKLKAEEIASISNVQSNFVTSSEATRNYRLRLYVDSKCPHCKNMLKTAISLHKEGFYIEVRQVDDDTSAFRGLPFVVEKAGEAELKEQRVHGVPMLLVGNLKTKKVFKVQGYKSAAEIFSILKM